MGHNLGMLHDFDDAHGGEGGPCDGKGFMSYGYSVPQQWSTCSKNDFEAHYNNVASQGGSFFGLNYNFDITVLVIICIIGI